MTLTQARNIYDQVENQEAQDRPYIVVGKIELDPTTMPWDEFRRELVYRMRMLGVSSPLGTVEIRDPGFEPTGFPADWHQDGGKRYINNSRYHVPFATWTNMQPTLVRWIGETKEYQPNPYELVIFDNGKVQHRPPYERIHPDRVFARVAPLVSLNYN